MEAMARQIVDQSANERQIEGGQSVSRQTVDEDMVGINQILGNYRRDLIEQINLLGIRIAVQEEVRFKNLDYFKETRLLAEIVQRDLLEYEDKLYMAFGLPNEIMKRYNGLLSQTERDRSIMDNMHCMTLMSTSQLLEVPMCVRQIGILITRIVEQIKSWEEAERQIRKMMKTDFSLDLTRLTLSEYREIYEERKYLGCWQGLE